MSDRKVIVIARRRAGVRRKRISESNGGGEKDAVVPDNGGRMAETRDFRLPADVRPIGFIPNQRGIADRRRACRERSAPLRPVVQRIRAPVVGKCHFRQEHGKAREKKMGAWTASEASSRVRMNA
jgi:hypothetical protein